MAAMETAFAALMTSGLPGVFVVILSIVVWRLYLDKQKSEADLRAAHLADMRSIFTLTESIKVQLVTSDSTINRLVEWLKEKDNR